MIIGTAGHIDHGKTALVRALTGVETDRLPEEKRRGITIDLGFAPLRDGDAVVAGIVDVPGHEAFVRTMIAGASGIDLALLVVAADEGVMPQTREHVAVLQLLGIRGGVVALTKADLVDAEWLDLVRADVVAALKGTALETAPMMAVSTVTGAGVPALRDALFGAVRAFPGRHEDDLFRMPIDRAFTVKGTGTVVTGTIWSGQVVEGTTLLLLPAGRLVRVRGVQSYGRSVQRSQGGTRTAIALAGVDVAEVRRGAWLAGGTAWPVSTVMRAEIALLPDAAPLRPREWVRLHLGTADVAARVVAPGGAIAAGTRRPARVMLAEPVAARALDRFVLRRASPVATIGGGVVIDPLPAHPRPRLWPAGLPDPAARLRLMLDEAAGAGVDESVLPIRIGRPAEVVAGLLDRADVVRIGSRVVGGEWAAAAMGRVREALDEYHHSHALEPGMPLSELRARSGLAPALADHAVERLARDGEIEAAGSLVRRPGWAPELTAAQAVLRDGLLATLRDGDAEPPDVPSLEADHPAATDVRRVLRFMEREGLVVAVEPDRYYAAAAVRRLVAQLRDGMTEAREYSPTELREVLGLSRKYLIPFLEFCDRQRITERRGGGRVLLDARGAK